MRTKTSIIQATLAAIALLLSTAATAALVDTDCGDTPGAIANGATPDHCAIGTTDNDSPMTETAVVNDVFADELGTADDPFYFVSKHEVLAGTCADADSACVDGFALAASDGTDPWDFMFELLTDYDGQVVDFVLMVKQPDENNPPISTNVAYAWTGLTLDIEGMYDSFNGTYSHISGFIRNVQDVSEPAPLALLGLGLLGVALLRRRAV